MESCGKVTFQEVRILRKLSLEEVSTKVNVPIRTLCKYEMSPGKIPLHIAVRLLRLYEADIDSIKT